MARSHVWFFLTATVLLAGPARSQTAAVEGRDLRIEFDASLHSRVVARLGGKTTVLGPFTASETISVAGQNVADFAKVPEKRQKFSDATGAGQRVAIEGTAPSLKKTVTITTYDQFPEMAFFDVIYTNTGNAALAVDGWTNEHYAISAGQGAGAPAFWSYQNGSYAKRPDWVLPLKKGFQQENFLGMNATDYGGGTPITDVWRRDVGIAVGHVEMGPKLVSLPVSMPGDESATVGVSYKTAVSLPPGGVLKTYRTFVAVHRGDYFETLLNYRRFMMKQGVTFHAAPESAFEPIWCAWGFGKTFTPSQVENALPIVKKLGFKWVGVDYGWETADGDWALDPRKFPNGDADMKALTDKIHAAGMKAQLWWMPLGADPKSDLVRSHGDELLLNQDGSQHKISFFNDWYLCPADRRVVELHQALTRKILTTWGYDGLKLDGMHMNAAPLCYNPAHRHARPEESSEAVPAFFKAIMDAALGAKADALVEFCPCGDAYSFFNIPDFNMSVASDPRGSFQVRSKGKTLKGLAGDDIAYFGDHVELSDGGSDFASTVGVGGIVGTQFTWPAGAAQRTRLDLTPEREATWGKWVRIYSEKMLSQGHYEGGLYDIGFDRPEAHAIRKQASMYYAFYAPDWDGKVELRGLEKRAYRITDYEYGQDLGTVRGPQAALDVKFAKHLLLEARPE